VKILVALGLLALLPLTVQAGTWSNLWQRPDQQGEKALDSGDPKAAASLFADPRLKAYAQLKAGEYAAAAQRLAPFSDAESEYNRGNALAQGGELSAALNAYETTLKHANLDPALRRDAEHNRDLVQRQLQAQEKPQQGSQSGQPSEAHKDNSESKSNQADAASKSADSGKSANTQGSKNSEHSEGAPQSGSQQSQGADQNPSREHEGERSASGSATEKGDQNAGRQVEKPEQPSNHAEASSPPQSPLVEGARPQGESNGKTVAQPVRPNDSKNGSAAQDEIPKSLTEQQLALDQWLRQIPDDPGGLLRRKFLIEHLMKQQGVQP
jgi:Ca-activated chloride channel family protein